jgi:serine/threonine-protein kinase
MMPEAHALESRPRLVRFGPFSFDAQNRLLSRNGSEIPLPPRVLGVLELLISRPGEVVTRQELMDGVWKDAFVTDTSLAEAISFLRQSLGDDPQAPRYVQTVHRRGYRFLSSLAPQAAPPPGPAAEPAQPVLRPSIARDLTPWSIAVVCAVLAISAVWQIARRPSEEAPPVVRFHVAPAAGTAFDRRAPALAISPDGRTLAWSACQNAPATCSLFVRQLDRIDPVPLRGTEGALSPFFAPDGRWIGFFADGKLKKIAVSGGAPATLAEAPAPAGAAWSADGRIVFAGTAAGGLSLVSDQGGDVKQLTKPHPERGELRHVWPSWLPGGNALVFTIAGSPLAGASSQIAVLQLPSSTSAASSWRVLRGGARAVAAGNGYLLVSTGTDVQAHTLDPRTLSLSSGADGMIEGLASAQGLGQFAVNDAGTLVSIDAADSPRQFTWSDQRARPIEGLDRLRDLVLSPDGRRAAGVSVDGAGSDIWVVDLDRGSAARVTYGGVNASPVLAADGTLLFASHATGPFAVVARAGAGGASTQTRVKSAGHVFPGSLAADGRVAVVQSLTDGRLAVGIVPSGGSAPVLFDDGPFDQAMPAFSPDGAWLAFASDESGRWNVYVRSLGANRRVAVSTGGGERPSWSADGKWIYFHDGPRVLRASFDPRADQPVGAPEILFDRADARAVAVAPNGRVLLEQQPPAPDSAVVVLQWLREVRQRLTPPVTAPR